MDDRALLMGSHGAFIAGRDIFFDDGVILSCRFGELTQQTYWFARPRGLFETSQTCPIFGGLLRVTSRLNVTK